MSLLIQNARVVAGDDQPVCPRCSVRIRGQSIAAIAESLLPESGETVIDANGRVLMPGFVDAHTHAAWAGDRLDEFELQQRGASYLEILQRGGGILATVRAVRAASTAELTESLVQRLHGALGQGTTTIEVKSGYGLSTVHELKLLHAIHDAAHTFPGTIVPTALLGHALDPDEPRFVERTLEETLPAVHAEFPGITIDAYCEQGAWSVDDCRRLLTRARSLGHPVRLHVDQFHALGGLELGLELGAHSVDHLEVTGVPALQALARSSTVAVVLPATGFHLDGRYANARALRDAGGKLVLASNYNPGSAPTCSMPFVIALAVRRLRLTIHEAIQAATWQAANLLGLPDRGRLAPGLRADLLMLRHVDERQLGFEVGGNPLDAVICAGRVVSGG